MKLLSLLIFGLVVGLILGADPTSPSTTPASTETTSSSAAPSESTSSTKASTSAPNTGSSVSSSAASSSSNPAASTTQGITTTTAQPLDRKVSFKVDCTQESQCDFTFKIAEKLMRYVNSTYLEQILGTLAGKIQTISNEIKTLDTEESGYEAYLTSKINEVHDKFDTLNQNVSDSLTTAQGLEQTATSSSDLITKYLAAATCFQKDLQPSVDCGALAGIGVASTTQLPSSIIVSDASSSTDSTYPSSSTTAPVSTSTTSK